MSHASERIDKIANIFNHTRYLEIGVNKGDTFLNVSMPHKTAVDVKFQFDTKTHVSPITSYFTITSDQFFADFPEIIKFQPYHKNGCDEFKFDLIYIDGLHTFEQSYRDFLNSLPFSHDGTIWILDDTVPSDPWSALPDPKQSYKYRDVAKVSGRPWHGDVFKTVFAIHDFHQEFSYATQINAGNPQTIIWKTDTKTERKPIFGALEKIKALSYFDLLDNAFGLLPVADAVAFELIGMALTPEDYKGIDDYKKIAKVIKTQ